MQCDCRFFDFCFVLFLPWIGQKEKKKDSTDKLRLKYLETLFPLRPKAVAVMSRQDKIITSQKCSPAPPPSYLPIAVRTGNAEKCSAVRTYIGNSSPPALLSCPAAFLCICVCVCVRAMVFYEGVSYHHSLLCRSRVPPPQLEERKKNAIMRYDNKAHS